MSDQKKVLVVDDRYEMLEFLRSQLDPNQGCELQAVPSAEEGLLEMRQTEFDLLITEVRLPGMSGFDLVRRTQRIKPDLPAIMVTEYSSEQGQQEAADLGVRHYFQKPLDTDMVIKAVNTALYGDLVVYPDDPDVPEPADIAISDEVQERLETLRSETAASQIVLATASGRVLYQVGRKHDIDLPKLMAVIAQNLTNSALIARELGAISPNTIQFHAGNEIEVYIANGGRDYFLVIFDDAQTRRARMMTIWVFAQRAIKDLLSMLPVLNTKVPPPFYTSSLLAGGGDLPAEPVLQSITPPFRDQAAVEADSQHSDKELDVKPEPPAPTESEGFFVLDESATQASNDLDVFWESAASESPAVVNAEGALSFEQAMHQGLISGETEPKQGESNVPSEHVLDTEPADLSALFALEGDTTANASDLDDFWGEAVAEQISGKPVGTGLSFEEAISQGLVPDAMNSEDMTVIDAERSDETDEDG